MERVGRGGLWRRGWLLDCTNDHHNQEEENEGVVYTGL